MAKPDYAHKMTDAELAKLEQRIAKLYKEAADELTDTVKAYFEQFEKRDASMKEKLDAGCKVGIICTDESRSHYPQGEVRSIGARKSQESVAHNLYALLREFDDLKVDYIFSESFTQDHLGQAIMNRLSKAAGYQIYKV